MLTSKERASLRAQANGLDTTLMVGKEGVTEQVVKAAEELLEARELIKASVQRNAPVDTAEAAQQLCEATGADCVMKAGGKFVLYRKSKKLEARRQAETARARSAARNRNPVQEGRQRRAAAAKKRREEKNAYFQSQRMNQTRKLDDLD